MASCAKSPLERLPPELRIKIYQFYLDSPIIEYQEQFHHDKVLQRKPCTTKAPLYRKGAHEGTGFWSPFGSTMHVLHFSRHVQTYPGVEMWSAPALWEVGGHVWREAQDYMLNERMRIAFTEIQTIQDLIRTHDAWKGTLRAEVKRSVRKLYLDVNYYDPVLTLEPNHENLRCSRDPLFKVELLDEGRTLRVMSLYPPVEWQNEMIKRKLASLFEDALDVFGDTAVPCDGVAIPGLADALVHFAQDNGERYGAMQ